MSPNKIFALPVKVENRSLSEFYGENYLAIIFPCSRILPSKITNGLTTYTHAMLSLSIRQLALKKRLTIHGDYNPRLTRPISNLYVVMFFPL
jgi:hypothetical protein